MIRLAYMVQCYKNPCQINRMIKALDYRKSGVTADFYIHVDRKSDISSEIIKSDNVFFVDDSKRADVRWGQISQIDASLSLLRTVIDSKREYDYVWLLSGQEYPIKSENYIINFFRENYGKNFINCLDNKSGIYKRFLKRNMLRYPGWIESPRILIKIIRRLYILITGGHYHTFSFFRKKQLLNNIEYYFGSGWLCITYQCAQYILNYLDKNPSHYNFFRDCEVLDECFFHTIIFNSPFSKEAADYLCYVDWSEHKRNPKILTTKDYNDLINSKYLVARKFDSSIDSKVLDMLDEHNRASNNN